LTLADDGRDQRQLGVVGTGGNGATFTGSACHDWAGGRAGDGYAVQGNILTGPEVVEAMEEAWLAGASSGFALPERLLATLAAGDEAGGDRRGRQSAALVVVRPGGGYGGDDTEVELRVDDHPSPVPELRRLLDLHRLYFGKPDPGSLLPLEGDVATEVARRLEALGYPSLDDWAGVENYEERMVPGHIDPLVLAKLREASSS
ncbi:MAG TPA: DUF1028 domain-containing protein, partial [Actinomycetes bacterium]|nr:DUF1028 domain-containing protein [Actinomycetes bacterium]